MTPCMTPARTTGPALYLCSFPECRRTGTFSCLLWFLCQFFSNIEFRMDPVLLHPNRFFVENARQLPRETPQETTHPNYTASSFTAQIRMSTRPNVMHEAVRSELECLKLSCSESCMQFPARPLCPTEACTLPSLVPSAAAAPALATHSVQSLIYFRNHC